jgi:transcriptional regulator with XRE-family HTH domain
MANAVNDDVKRIANNLLTLREHKGDTRKSLVEKLGVYPYDTIVSYELGKRNVPEDYIEAVAKLYHVSVNMIKEQRLTKDLLVIYDSSMDISDFYEKHDFWFYATATSEAARANENFKKAEEYRERIENLDCMETMPNSARTLYYKAFIEDGILAGAANTIMMLFVEYSQTNMMPDVFSKMKTGDLTNGEFYIQFRSLFSDLTPEKKKFIQTNEAVFDKCLTALGSVDQGRIYAEYYTALKYLLCMIDNGRGYRENLEIGAIMMKEFSTIGNPLAKKAVEFFEFE